MPLSSFEGMESPVTCIFEMALSSDDHVAKLVDAILDQWHGIAKLFLLLEKSNWLKRLSQISILEIKSYTWSNLTVFYGPGRSARANVIYSLSDKCYKIYFGLFQFAFV